MKYYIIVGEASGDLHASHLMHSLKEQDGEAEFRFFGGDNMQKEAPQGMVRHYRELAYMGFIPVLMHLPTILKNMKMCKEDIMQWNPDKVILVDYAGFNLSIAKFLRQQQKAGKWQGHIIYYIAPKIWAWKEYRIKNFKRDIDTMLSILPFEKEFFEGKHNYPIHYVGNPTADEVRQFKTEYKETCEEFCKRNALDTDKPIIALLAGSRRQEIKDNLTAMLSATRKLTDYQMVVAGAPGIEKEYYSQFTSGKNCAVVYGETYPLLSHSTSALVTSGTATLETACFNVPQVVCYKTPVPKLCRWGFDHILSCKYISLVNLIADSEVVPELFADRFSVKNIRQQLLSILPNGWQRQIMLDNYKKVHERLGDTCAPDNAAKVILKETNK